MTGGGRRPAYGDGAVGANFQASVEHGRRHGEPLLRFVAVKVGRTQVGYAFSDDPGDDLDRPADPGPDHRGHGRPLRAAGA